MNEKTVNMEPKKLEDQEWWQKYSAYVRAQEMQRRRAMAVARAKQKCEQTTDRFEVRYNGSGSGSLGIRYVGSGSGSLGIRYVGSGSGSLGIRYVGSGSGSLGICYVGSGSGSPGIRYVGSGSGSLGIRYVGSVSSIPYTGSGSGSRYMGSSICQTPIVNQTIVIPEEEALQNPYAKYDRSRFPGETSGTDTEGGILGYGLGLI